MAARDGARPQLVDPDVLASLVRLLSVVGPLGVLEVSDVVVPVVSLGNVVQPTVDVVPPAFTSGQVHTNGVQVAAPINTLHADTGALPAGTYDIILTVEPNDTTVLLPFTVEHRDAANAANIVTWTILTNLTTGAYPLRFGYTVGPGERLRVLNSVALAAGDRSSVTIFEAIR